MSKPKLVIIGAGNVASHLALALDGPCNVVQVCARSAQHASELAAKLKDCTPIADLSKLITTADYYIIAVNDDAIATVAQSMPKVDGVVAHTSGSVPMEALRSASPHIGVFYPLQTFSKTAKVEIGAVPFFTEASDPETLQALDSLAASIGARVSHADSRQRSILHIAAVFACNFANRLWAISDDILRAEGYSLDVLYPLLSATLDKAMSMPPALAQTGPAARGDHDVIDKHLSMLSPENKAIYSLLSDSIMSAALTAKPDATYTK